MLQFAYPATQCFFISTVCHPKGLQTQFTKPSRVDGKLATMIGLEWMSVGSMGNFIPLIGRENILQQNQSDIKVKFYC